MIDDAYTVAELSSWCPFQWSLHVERADGSLHHAQYLDVEGFGNVRDLASALLSALPREGPVFVYNRSLEKGVLELLARLVPDAASRLQDVVSRLVDLWPITKAAYYHPAMRGSWSIKAVLPTIDSDNETSSTGSRTSDYLSNTQRRTALRATGKPMTDNSIASNPSRSTSITLTSQPSPRPLNGMQSRRAAPFASCRAFLLPPPGMVLAAIIALTAIMAPVSSPAQDQPPTTDKNFTLVHGDGAAVCDAYLQVLNQTHFDVTPFCGRPDDGTGFMHLRRHYWGVDQIFQLVPHVYGFMVFDNQFHLGRWFSPNPENPNKPLITTNPETQDSIADSLHRNWMRMWSYEEPIDIENDGSSLDVLIWQDGGTRCGSDYADHPWTFPYVPQQAFIINSDGKTIDERLTRTIFGVPEESSPARLTRRPSKSPFLPVGANPFRPLAESVGIFGYHGRYYIETENRPNTKGGPLPPVIVYLREHNHTAKVCAFRPENVPVPVD